MLDENLTKEHYWPGTYKLEKGAYKSLMKVNDGKCKILPLEQDNPVPPPGQVHYSLTAGDDKKLKKKKEIENYRTRGNNQKLQHAKCELDTDINWI